MIDFSGGFVGRLNGFGVSGAVVEAFIRPDDSEFDIVETFQAHNSPEVGRHAPAVIALGLDKRLNSIEGFAGKRPVPSSSPVCPPGILEVEG